MKERNESDLLWQRANNRERKEEKKT